MFSSRLPEKNDEYVTKQQLAILWSIGISLVNATLSINKIKRIGKIKQGQSVYDRAECEAARPFINQSKKEVEKVENIGELATATKHQILCETGADNFVWNKVTMKNKIMLVKNYCDERGNFVSLFKKDETVSAILAYKNEQKQLLEKCLADKNLVTTKDLETIWNCKKSNVYSKIYKLEIKPHAKVKLENGYIWHFYKKSDCIDSQEVEEVEQMNIPEPKEQTPDIIPADTIDLFTMSELETELKNRGVELTTEVKAKINASDMPEMQDIATMIKGNAKTIAIRLSVLNEIAGQLRSYNTLEEEEPTNNHKIANADNARKMSKWERSWLDLWEKVDAEIDAEESTEEIKEIKKVLARHGSPTARVCKDMLQKHGYIGFMEAGYLLKMTYYTLQRYAQTFTPDIVATMGYSPSMGYENGKSTSFFWKRERVLTHADELNQIKEDKKIAEQIQPKMYENMAHMKFDWHMSLITDNHKLRLIKMAECDRLTLSLKIEQIIDAAWIMGNYDNK